MKFAFLFLVFTCPVFGQWQQAAFTRVSDLPGGARLVTCDMVREGRVAGITAVLFDEKTAVLRVADNAEKGRLSQAAAGSVAGVNGGYFHPDFKPAGLVVSQGRELHPFERAKLLSGVLVVKGKRMEIVRSGNFTMEKSITDALQAGPFLVEGAKSIAGLNDLKAARRTVVATNGKGSWCLLLITPLTLADASLLLSAPGCLDGWGVKTALNLDGGSSSGLWAAAAPVPRYLAEFATVRNFLLVEPR